MTEDDLNKYREFVLRNAYPTQKDRSIRAFNLMLEAAEVGNEIKRIQTKDNGEHTPYRMTKILEEMGDTFYYFVLLMEDFGISFEEMIQYNVAKLEERHGNRQPESTREYLQRVWKAD